ncbi:DNA-formamidopyrimidine glycosylase family protein [Haematomicrobium sanguinis]|uniref:DNA-formamidopyrimidine glycosylase family protein n=1 Tax=Haematomicrobium sanguinis TaxID=479106 RepID=UPI00047BDCC8|nr:DNA-formamidopyrimidine glycosylase family protein [Haematomicrobium sanguinis]
MPELPEVEALRDFLQGAATRRVIDNIGIVAINALKTADPPIDAAVGATVTGASRWGKFLGLDMSTSGGAEPDLYLIIHFARSGWLQWNEHVSDRPLRMSTRNPLAARVTFTDGAGFTVTEHGSKKSLAIYLVRSPEDVPGIAELGPDALGISREDFERAINSNHQSKNLLTDQRRMAGIGNAYSDEILWEARLSPAKLGSSLTDTERETLFNAVNTTLGDATERVRTARPATLKAEKRQGMNVHGRFGQACPRCGDTIAQVSFADSDYQYCPTCQTKGKRLSDRRMDRMLK